MTLEFPSSPTNDQVYENYIYNSTVGAWQKLPGNTFADAAISDTPPVNPNNGDLWWNSADGQFYVYYNDGSSAQWVSASMPSVAVSDTPPAGYEGQLWLDSTDGSMYVYYTDPGGASSSWIGAVSRSGGILQVVSTTKTDTFSTTSTPFIDIPGLSLSITPSSTSSKILVTGSLSMRGIEGTNNAYARLLRGSTPIFAGDADGSRLQGFVVDSGGAGNNAPAHPFEFLDQPSTTSTLTYKLQMRVTTSTGYINRSSLDTNDGTNGMRTASTITLIEVAG